MDDIPSYISILCSRCGTHTAWVQQSPSLSSDLQRFAMLPGTSSIICNHCVADEFHTRSFLMGGPAATLWQTHLLSTDDAARYWERQDATIRLGNNLRDLEIRFRVKPEQPQQTDDLHSFLDTLFSP